MWLLFALIALVLSTVPVVIGAHVLRARRRGFLICMAALAISYLITGFAFRALHGLGFLALFASGLGYMLVLDTTYWRGLGIAVIHAVLMAVLFFALAATMFHGVRDMMRHVPREFNAPVQWL
jgi:hypothetical protein